MGNRTDAFSKVGDCESQTTWYLWDFDQGEGYYSLGPYAELQPVIDHFEGSFERLSLAARYGFTAASVMTPLWADREKCEKDESPLACEFRIHRPSIVLITLGANDAVRPETLEKNMRRVIEYSIEQGVVPILDTKADNREGAMRPLPVWRMNTRYHCGISGWQSSRCPIMVWTGERIWCTRPGIRIILMIPRQCSEPGRCAI